MICYNETLNSDHSLNIKLVFISWCRDYVDQQWTGALHNRRSLLLTSTYRLWQSALMLSFHSLRTTHHCSCHTENTRLLTAVSWCSRPAEGNTLPNTRFAQMVRYFLARNLPMDACKDKHGYFILNMENPVGIVLEQLISFRVLHCTGAQNSNQLCSRYLFLHRTIFKFVSCLLLLPVACVCTRLLIGQFTFNLVDYIRCEWNS